MQVEKTALKGVYVLTPRRHVDPRGFFSESYNKKTMSAAGFHFDFVQDNHSLSHDVGTVRGLHFQRPDMAQDKLVRCGRGALFDVAVDIRRGSPSYGQWVGEELTFENGKQLLVPAGFAHGFVTRMPDTEIIYKCTNTYSKEHEGALRYDCPEIGIAWDLDGVEPVLSQNDQKAGGLAGFESPFVYED